RSFSTFRPWHLGHATVSSPKTNSSNTCSHFRHSYSYRGMAADLESLVQLLATLAVDFTRPQQDLLLALREAALALTGHLGQHRVQLGLQVRIDRRRFSGDGHRLGLAFTAVDA